MRGSKGFFFTVGVLLLLIPLIFLITYYISKDVAKADDVTGKIRCDELYYFVEDVLVDLSRACEIFGRRATVYAVDRVISNEAFIGDYEFNCTEACGVNCSVFNVPVTGSEAALTELALCGTLYGVNVTYMVNHTIPQWIELMENEGSDMNFNVSIQLDEVRIIPYDAFTFALILNQTLRFADKNGLCFFEKDNIVVDSYTSIVGIEDPLYAVKTEGDIIRYINDCPIDMEVNNIAGSSDRGYGNGTGGGSIFFATEIPQAERNTYCSTHDVSAKFLLIPGGFGACNLIEQKCYNISAPDGDHFAGVINYGPDDPTSFSLKCDITIPWISDTDDLNLTLGDCAYIKNTDECWLHDVYNTYWANETNTTCYQVSDISPYLSGCDTLANGPSFFDRLDGNLNLTEKYTNQSLAYYGIDDIGIETFINPYELDDKDKIVLEDTTWIDYLYLQNISGCEIPAFCNEGMYPFALECAHTKYFRLDSTCINASGFDPASWINLPEDGDSLNCSDSPFTISGNASDCDGTVENVSVYLGDSWQLASLTDPDWSISWNVSEEGTYTIVSKASDTEGFTEDPGFDINVTVYSCVITSTTVSGPTTTTTTIVMASVASDNFESGGWGGGSGWIADWYREANTDVVAAGVSHGGLYHLRLRKANEYASRRVNLAGMSGASVRFWAKVDDFEVGETAELRISDDGGDSWVSMETWVDGDDDNVYRYYEYDVNAYMPSDEFVIAFDAEMSNTADYFYIDDLEVYGG
ncbi:MAG: hypothetical protein ABH851_09575, partial [Methanobacteriota archaeon]